MTGDLRARIVAALEDCRALIPEAQADAVMAVVQPEIDRVLAVERDRGILDYLRTHPEHATRLMREEMQRQAVPNGPGTSVGCTRSRTAKCPRARAVGPPRSRSATAASPSRSCSASAAPPRIRAARSSTAS